MHVQKPAFLPDFGLRRRLDVLHRFFGPIDRRTYEELLAPDFTIPEYGPEQRRYSRAEWINLMCNHVSMAIPDFSWTAATDGKVAADGYAVVTVQACGHHTGTPLSMLDLPPVRSTHIAAADSAAARLDEIILSSLSIHSRVVSLVSALQLAEQKAACGRPAVRRCRPAGGASAWSRRCSR